MSPSRTRKPVTRTRPRGELIGAIALGVGIVVATLLIIWLIRPGASGTSGTGGLFTRQSRVTLLVVGTGLALAGVLWWMLRGRHRPRRISRRVAVIVSCVVVVGGAILLGVFWPGGVVRHYQSLTEIPETPQSPPDTGAPTTAPHATISPTSAGGG